MTSPKQPQDRKRPKPKPKPKPDTTPPDAPDAVAYKTVPIKGREIAVKKPTEDQILVWHRVLSKFDQLGKHVDDADQLNRLLNKLDMIMTSLIINKEDAEWLEDAQLLGEVSLREAGRLVEEALEAYGDEIGDQPANRAARRAKG